MIYFDNAATTMLKPPQVAQAVAAAINSFGGVGRGTHSAALDAAMAVYKTRRQIARLFNASDPKHVVFTHNVTEALNIAILGLVGPGCHVITTAASHNSVLRPLNRVVDERRAELILSVIKLLIRGRECCSQCLQDTPGVRNRDPPVSSVRRHGRHTLQA